MFRMVLVDDETSVLEGIQAVFPLADRGFEVVGAFTNPLQALDSLERLRPDVVITDIKMPQLGGLEFSERALDLLPEVQIVILSGYEEFEFARTALRIGVADYLLKPVKKGDFEAMLTTVGTRIAEKQAQRTRILEAGNGQKRPHEDPVNGFFQDWLEGTGDPGLLETRHDELGFDWCRSPYLLLKLMLRKAPSGLGFEAFLRCARAFFPLELRTFGTPRCFHAGEHVFFLIGHWEGEAKVLKDRLSGSLRQFDAQYGIACTAALSAVHTGLPQGPAADLECEAGLMNAFSSDRTVADSEDPAVSSEAAWSGDETEALLLAISRQDASQIDAVLDELFRPTSSLAGGVDYYYSLTLVLLVRLSGLPTANAGDEPVVSASEANLRSLKKTCRSVAMLKTLVRSKALALMEAGTPGRAAPGKIVQAVVQHIGDHLSDELSLADLAALAGISKNYLCSVFKKETGTTLLNYLVETRMRKAKKLLRSGGTKMYEIAEAVGYRDYAYFSQVFKKTTGMTLSEYRNTM